MSGLSVIGSAIGRLFKTRKPSVQEVSPAVAPPDAGTTVPSGIHPGLTDQQLVVLLTAAASEVMGGTVRIEKLRYLPGRNGSWVNQGRSELHTHRLK
jgi:hypothetical protein